MITKDFKTLAGQARNFLEGEASAHDFHHAERVFNNAMYLQKHEGGDKLVIGFAALVHDICRPWEKKTGKSHFGKEALKIIKKVLENSDVPHDKVQQTLDIVQLHDIYDWSVKHTNKSIELQVVQDADNLDAIGALGIARTFAFGGSNGLPMYIPAENLTFEKDFIDDPKHRTSTIAHFYEKLLKLKQNMNTKTGIEIAKHRHTFMEGFLKEFFDEWEGKFD